MTRLILVISLFLSHAFAQDLVFMREDSQGKHIILKTAQGESQLTSGTDWHLYPDITSDGRYVTWVQGPDANNLQVVVLDRQTSTREMWRSGLNGMTLHPRFSRSGEWLFFSVPTGSNHKIMFLELKNLRSRSSYQTISGMRVYDVAPQSLIHDGTGHFPRPSSDAGFLVYQRNFNGKREIVIYDRISDTSEVIAEGMAPALSFDEQLIAYTSKVNGNWDIFVYDRINKTTTQATSNPHDEMAPVFMTDNSLVFAGNSTGHFQLYKNVNGQMQPLVASNSDDYAPNFAGEIRYQQSSLPSFPAPLRSSFGAIVHDGKLYLCGGHQGAEHTYPPESFTNNLQAFDFATGQWSELAPRPALAHGYQLAVHGKYLYAFGGFTYSANHRPGWKSIAQIDRYDIETNQWTTVGQLSSPRSSNVAVTVDGKVYIIGGWDSTPRFHNDYDGTFQSDVDVFDMATETLQKAPWQIPSPLRRAFSAVEHNGKIVLVGGLGVGASHFELIDRITEINPYTGFANELPILPFATFAPAAGILNNELFVFGGMFKTGAMNYEYVSHVYALDLDQLTWRHTGRFLNETKGFAQVVSHDDMLLIIGGHRYFAGMDSPVATMETFK